jgi:type VI secretion system secreted protein VgrG
VNPRSGKAPKAVAPAAPKAAEDADSADPGEVEQAKAAQREKGEGKYGATPAKPHMAGEDDGKTSWIEIELVDEDDQPVPGEKYEINLPDGSVASGTLDEKGLARVEGIDPGTCRVTFPDLDKDAWEPRS